MPVPGTNDEEWDRLEPASALDALVELVLHGEYNGIFAEKRKREEMELRAAALAVFQVIHHLFGGRTWFSNRMPQNFVQKPEICEAIIQAMLPSPGK